METFGEKLKSLRTAANLTQVELIKAAGVSEKTLVVAENAAQKRMSPKKYAAVIKVLAMKLGKTERMIDAYLNPIAIPPGPEELDRLDALNEFQKTQDVDQLRERIREIEAREASSEWRGELSSNMRPRQIPLAEEIAAGPALTGDAVDMGDFPADMQLVPGELFPWDNDAFGLRIRGHSMYDKFEDGDVVIASPLAYVNNEWVPGDVVCVRFTRASRFGGGRTLKIMQLNEDDTYRLESINPSEQFRDPRFRKIEKHEIEAVGKVVVHIRNCYLREGFTFSNSELARKVPRRKPQAEQPHPNYEGPNADSFHPED